jgi:hypothetical protein
MGKGYLIHRRRKMAKSGLAERGLEAGAAIAGGRAVDYAKHGNCRKAIMWAVPLVAAGVLIWYMRR